MGEGFKAQVVDIFKLQKSQFWLDFVNLFLVYNQDNC